MYLLISFLIWFFFLLLLQGSFFYCFLSVWRIFLSHSLKTGLLATNSLCFPSFVYLYNFSLFLKDIFGGQRIWSTQYFCCVALKKTLCQLPSGLHSFWWEIHWHWLSCICKVYFFQLLLSFFFYLSLVFRSIIMMYHGIDFFRFILLGVRSTSWIKYFYLAKFGKISAIISLNTFTAIPSFSFSGVPVTWILGLWV